MTKRLAVCFDGTWNTRSDRTNVVRIHDLAVAPAAPDGMRQLRFYDEGVGIHWYDTVRGGVFGWGLSKNIRDGYRFLAKNFEPGDEIYIFGFSRGAYTARSLAGMIRKAGVLRDADDKLLDRAYEMYRDKELAPDGAQTAAFRARHSHETRIRFIGVWDTVGALGIPSINIFRPEYYRWYDTELSKIVDYAYHALAIDEHRETFAPTVWTRVKPENRGVEQRWFVGAHSNVGGGYRDDPLHRIPLRWMMDKAAAAGLHFHDPVVVGADDHKAPINDSYSEFMRGAYKLFKGGKRFHRRIGQGANETIDESVWRRWDECDYRPPSLMDLAQQPGRTPALAAAPGV